MFEYIHEKLTSDRLLCYSTIIPSGRASCLDSTASIHAACFTSHGKCQYSRLSALDQQHFRRISSTVCYSMGCHHHRYLSCLTHLTIDWFGYIVFIILIRGTLKFFVNLGNKLRTIFAYYPGISNSWK